MKFIRFTKEYQVAQILDDCWQGRTPYVTKDGKLWGACVRHANAVLDARAKVGGWFNE